MANASEVGIERPVGVGLAAGSVPGLTLKIWTRPTSALDFGVGFGLGGFACTDRVNVCDRRASVHADYLFHSGRSAGDRFSAHVGFGARLWFWDYQAESDEFRLAARIPLGVDLYLFKWLEAYVEVVPSLAVSPVVIFLEGALGARMYL
ncbi:MAG TPA: hypothetical protein VGL59_01615 [Polyangia bacterium]